MTGPLEVTAGIGVVIYTIVLAAALAILHRRAAAARHEAAEQRARLDEARELLERTRAAATDANRAKSLFLANMSHELRTPLHTIIDYSTMAVEILEADDEATELTSDIKRIGVAGRHLLAVVDAVLDLSRAEAGQTRLAIESFDASAALREIADAAAPSIAANGNAFELRVGDLGIMRSDPGKLRQVLLNLLSNAGKYTKDGRVMLSAARSADGRAIAFEVRDTGRGMRAEERRQLFRPFTAVPEPATQQGLGLGLALSWRFCALMGGDIDVRSEPGEGSTFTVCLPAAVPEFAASGIFIAPPAARLPELIPG